MLHNRKLNFDREYPCELFSLYLSRQTNYELTRPFAAYDIYNISPGHDLMDHTPSVHCGIKEVSGERNLSVYISKKFIFH